MLRKLYLSGIQLKEIQLGLTNFHELFRLTKCHMLKYRYLQLHGNQILLSSFTYPEFQGISKNSRDTPRVFECFRQRIFVFYIQSNLKHHILILYKSLSIERFNFVQHLIFLKLFKPCLNIIFHLFAFVGNNF